MGKLFRNAKSISAFTLAEVLITLMIIGVVAAVTIPALINNINNNTLAKQRKTVASKIAEGFAQMRVNGVLNESFNDTLDFVNRGMKQYFKITAVCETKETLKNCFSSTVTSVVNGASTENTIDEIEDVSNVVGLILSDGTNMLIKYNKDGIKIDEGNTQAGRIAEQKDDNGLSYATYGDLIYYRFDANGFKAPNTTSKDIIGNLSLAKGQASLQNVLGFSVVGDTTYPTSSGQAGAAQFCAERNASLMTKDQAMQIKKAIFGNDYTEVCEGPSMCYCSKTYEPIPGPVTDAFYGKSVWLKDSSDNVNFSGEAYTYTTFNDDPSSNNYETLCVGGN